MEIKNVPGTTQLEEMDKVPGLSRRRFFQLAGGIAGAGLLLEACHKHNAPDTVFLGSGDTALLNYLYILQQLEAAFYIQAVATPYYGMNESESMMFTDMRDQEIAHREYLKGLLGKDHVMDISPNFSSVTFADRTSTLSSAAIIEDMVISAMNGAVRLFTAPQYIYAIAKMATVEARHSATVRDLLTHNSFADNTAVNNYGLDAAGSPATVFANAQAYIHTTFDASKLPN